MASPQVENGFTRIANELLEALMKADLNGTQFRIMLAVIRESYGRRSTTTDLSYTRIAVLVEQPRTVVGRNLKQLVQRNFLRHSGDELSTWSVQKDYSQWLGSDQSVTSHQTVTSDQMVPKSSDQMVPSTSDQSVTHLKKEERKKESGGVANGHAAADPYVVSELEALGLNDRQVTKCALLQQYTPEIFSQLKVWSKEKSTKPGIRSVVGLLVSYLERGKLPDDLPPPPEPEQEPVEQITWDEVTGRPIVPESLRRRLAADAKQTHLYHRG